MNSCSRVLPCWLGLCCVAGCDDTAPLGITQLADPAADYMQYELRLHQELTNDAPIGPGEPQSSDHCPQEPGTWFAGSGRSTGRSDLFGDLTEVEVYCINVERSELSGGLATWTDVDGDSISMAFGAKLLSGFAYEAAPNAPVVGYAHFNGGTGKWQGLSGAALLSGRQNGDGTATLMYRGTINLPQ